MKQLRLVRRLLPLAVLSIGWVMAAGGQDRPVNKPSAPFRQAPVLVELFTSEGCSSCPSADSLLARLGSNTEAEVIPLEEHVDYWNHLGWSDPFSTKQFTTRQQSYVSLFHLEQVYTPEMVVEGSKEFMGSDESAAHNAISAARRAEHTLVSITAGNTARDGSDVSIQIAAIESPTRGETVDVIAGITQDNLQSSVLRGENAGKRLSHIGVVRHLDSVGTVEARKPFSRTVHMSFDPLWKRSDLHVVAFAQGHDSGKVYGVGAVSLK